MSFASISIHPQIISKEISMSEEKMYFEALSKELGIDLEISQDGCVSLSQNNRNLLIKWNEREKKFIVYAEIGQLLGWNDFEIMRQLLSANFLFFGSNGGTLSYTPINNSIGFNYCIPANGLSPEEFVNMLNAVVLLADEWKNNLDKMQEEQERTAERNIEKILDFEDDTDSNAVSSMNFIKI